MPTIGFILTPMDPLTRAIAVTSGGRRQIAKACQISVQALQKWESAGRLPRSEFSGETEYSEIIERETDGEVTAEELLRWSREGWQQRRRVA
jgi:hypothetical protein